MKDDKCFHGVCEVCGLVVRFDDEVAWCDGCGDYVNYDSVRALDDDKNV